MDHLPHEHTLDTGAFLNATLKAVESEYEFVEAKVGQARMLQDIDSKRMARIAVTLLEEVFQDEEDPQLPPEEAVSISATDEASLEHLRLLADELGSVNGYRLTLINDEKLILDQTVRTKDACLMVISLEASLSPMGIYVAKDRHIALEGHAVAKDVLEVGPEDIAIIDQFIQKIIDLK